MTRPQIVAGPDEGEDPDLDLEGPDPDDEPDEDDDPPPRRQRQQRRTEPDDVAELRAENERLRERNHKNNAELAKRRHVQQFMETHKIEDLDTWLTGLGVDRETGQRVAPPAPTPAPTPDSIEFERRLGLETEKLQAQHDEAKADWEARHGKLSDYVKRSAVEAALAKAGFNGTIDKALRVMDLNSISVAEGDDGEPAVDGVDDAIASLRTEIPEWFRQRNGSRPPRAGGDDVDGGRKRPAAPPRAGWDQQVVARLTGQRS